MTRDTIRWSGRPLPGNLAVWHPRRSLTQVVVRTLAGPLPPEQGALSTGSQAVAVSNCLPAEVFRVFVHRHLPWSPAKDAASLSAPSLNSTLPLSRDVSCSGRRSLCLWAGVFDVRRAVWRRCYTPHDPHHHRRRPVELPTGAGSETGRDSGTGSYDVVAESRDVAVLGHGRFGDVALPGPV